MAVDLSHSWVNKPALCKVSLISAHPFLVKILQKQCPKALTVIEIRLVWASLVHETGRYTNWSFQCLGFFNKVSCRPVENLSQDSRLTKVFTKTCCGILDRRKSTFQNLTDRSDLPLSIKRTITIQQQLLPLTAITRVIVLLYCSFVDCKS